jgi:2-keto-4-pentenoate hydratase
VRIEQAVAALLEAYETGNPISPLTDSWPDLSLDDAYEIQQQQLRHWLDSGDTVIGYKVGLTSRAMQRMFGVDEPDFGHVLASGRHSTTDTIDLGRYLQPRVEPEVAFVLGKTLTGPGVDMVTAASAVAEVLPAIEIIDSRIADWRIKLADTVADNASGGGVVVGSPVPQRLLNLALLGCNVWRNGTLAATGISGAVLGHPLLGLVWLANTLGARGVALEAGALVLSGACTAAVTVDPGDAVFVDFDGLGSASVLFSRDGSPS